MSVMYEHERNARTTSRLQRKQQGLALCHRVTLDSVAHPVGLGMDTHGTAVPLRRKAVGGPTATPRDDPRQTTREQRRS